MFTAQAAAGVAPPLPTTKSVGLYVDTDASSPCVNCFFLKKIVRWLFFNCIVMIVSLLGISLNSTYQKNVACRWPRVIGVASCRCAHVLVGQTKTMSSYSKVVQIRWVFVLRFVEKLCWTGFFSRVSCMMCLCALCVCVLPVSKCWFFAILHRRWKQVALALNRDCVGDTKLQTTQ